MSQQFIKNEQGTFDEIYRDFVIRPTEDGFTVLNPDGTPTGYTPKTRATAVAVIDTKHRRCEELAAEAAKRVSKPQIDVAAILTAADRLSVGARKMGRAENNPNDLI
jgi:hypothetical protein